MSGLIQQMIRDPYFVVLFLFPFCCGDEFVMFNNMEAAKCSLWPACSCSCSGSGSSVSFPSYFILRVLCSFPFFLYMLRFFLLIFLIHHM